MLITAFNTKGGVGKSTILQQLILPSLPLDRYIVYIDTDKMNKSSRHIENSKFVYEVITQQITDKEDIAKLLTIITEKLSNDEIVVLDPPAADSASNILEIIFAFNEYSFVFVPTLDESDTANTEKVLKVLQNNNVNCAIVFNKKSDNAYDICLDNLSAVLDYANSKQKTIIELAEETADNLKDKAFISLIQKVYVPKLNKQIEKVRRLLWETKK